MKQTSESPAMPPQSVTPAFAAFEWGIAFRYLRPNRRDGFISIFSIISFLGFFIGVMVLVVVLAVMNGFRSELFERILGVQGHVDIRTYVNYQADLLELQKKIVEVEGVTRVTAVVSEQVLISAGGSKSFGTVRGITAEDLRKTEFIAGSVIEGSLEDFGAEGSNGIVIGRKLATSLGVFKGQQIATTSANGVETPFGSVPRTIAHTVVAIFDSGFQDADQYYLYMPREVAQLIYNQEGMISFLEVFIDQPDDVEAMTEKMRALSPESVYFSTWHSKFGAWRSALDLERKVMFLILSMIILVATLNILGSLVMMVMVKTKTIAVLRTIGMARGAVMRIFMITGTMVGVIGSSFGFIAGLAIAFNTGPIENFFKSVFGLTLLPKAYFGLDSIPSEVRLGDNLVILAIAFVLAILGTLYPSWRAARIDPVEALRYE